MVLQVRGVGQDGKGLLAVAFETTRIGPSEKDEVTHGTVEASLKVYVRGQLTPDSGQEPGGKILDAYRLLLERLPELEKQLSDQIPKVGQ